MSRSIQCVVYGRGFSFWQYLNLRVDVVLQLQRPSLNAFNSVNKPNRRRFLTREFFVELTQD